MFPSFFPYHHHRSHGGGIYNNLVVNIPHECRHEWRQPYWPPMPMITENITQIQGQGQKQGQGQVS
jgi:hypothetical protein